MEREELRSVIEAMIFVAEEPMSVALMSEVLGEEGINKAEIEAAIEGIRADYNADPARGLQIVEVAGGYQFRTKPKCADWLQRLNVPKAVRLSQPALETLAVIAYRQPTLRSDIEAIRGVDCGGVLKTLLEKGLIRIICKSDEPGNPLVYGTTKAFLETFGLSNLKELPTLREIDGLDVREKIGDLGRGEAAEGEGCTGEGVGEIIAEYREEITAYRPDPEKIAEDDMAIRDLEESIKNLRRLEKDVFPKPVEEVCAVPKETEGDGPAPQEGEGGAAAQDSGEVDRALPEKG